MLCARQAGERRDGRPQVGGQAAQLVLGDQPAQLADERDRRVERGLGGAARPGRRSCGERAQRRERRVERGQRGLGGAQRPRQLGDRRAQVALLAGERGGRRVEVGDQALELGRVAVQRRGRRAGALDVAGEVVLGLARATPR